MITLSKGLGALGLALVLVGCSGQNSDLKRWTEQVKEKPGGELDPIPSSPEYDRFVYQAHELRDPFTAFKRTEQPGATQGPRPDPDRPREPLEEFALDSLKMVGSIGSGSRISALVMDPNKVTHRLGPGQRLGQRDGRIIAIDPSRLVLIELAPNGSGGWEEVQTVVNLSEAK